MSVDVLISPRISFSHDIDVSEEDPSVTGDTSSSSIDFDFAFTVHNQGALIRQSSTADELFSDGKLLPVSISLAACNEIAEAEKIDLVQIQSPGLNKIEDQKIIKSLKDYLQDNTDSEEEDETAPRSTAARAFWQFRRSSSLNVSHYGRNRGKQSIPSKLKFLSRSKSTGGKTLKEEEEEETKPNLPTLMEDDKNTQNRGGLIGSLKVILLRSNSIGEDSKQFTIRRSSSLNCDRSYPNRGLIMNRSNSTGSVHNPKRIGIHNEKKEFLKQSSGMKKGKSQGRRSFKDYYENFYSGEKVNPVLNLPSPYISRASVDLLGFASLFCNGRYRTKRK